MDTDRVLGRLEEFRDWSRQEHRQISEHLRVLNSKVDRINQDRWILKGQLVVVTSIVVAVIQLATKKILGIE